MSIIYFFFHRVLLLAVSTFAAWNCMLRFGHLRGLFVWSAIMLGLSILSGILLRTSPVGKLTWKNRLSGYLIPWGHSLRLGRLVPIVVTSLFSWILIGVAVHLLTRDLSPRADYPKIPPLDKTRFAILGSWVIFTSCIVYLLGIVRKNYSFSSSGAKSIFKVMAVLCALLAASVYMQVTGNTYKALCLTGIPVLVLAAIGAIYLGAIMILFSGKGGHH